MNEYVMGELDKLRPLETAGMFPEQKRFKIKLTSMLGETHYMDINYPTYIRIARILLEAE